MERDIERLIVRYVESLGGVAPKLLIANESGFPDRTILLPGKPVLFLEVKQSTGTVSRQQRRWIARLQELGQAAEVVRSLEQAREVMGRL